MSSESLLREAEAAYRMGNLPVAARLCRSMLKGDPDDVDAWILQGAVRLRQNDPQGAIDSLLKAAELAPERSEPHLALAPILGRAGNGPGFAHHAKKAQELSSAEPEVLNHIGFLWVEAGGFAEAAACFAEASALDPANVSYQRNRASALRDAGNEPEALEAWELVTEMAPNLAVGWLSLGQLRMGRGDFEAAIECGRRAVQADPKSADAHLLLALALSEIGRGLEAEPSLKTAIWIDPKSAVGHAALGFWLQEQGRFEEAWPALQKAIELRPTHGFAYYNLFRAKKATEDDAPFMERMQQIAESNEGSPMDSSYLYYALGKAREDLGDYDRAMEAYDAANGIAYRVWLGRRPWDREAYASGFSRTIDRFTPTEFARLRPTSNPSEKPLLIVGMIRSGTSLVEQILSSHPMVAGAGELAFWHDNEPLTIGEDGEIDPEKLQGVAERYLAKLGEIAPDAQRVTDKLPHNYALLGHIYAAFPNARIIHMSRNPVDNCLSVYTTAYQRPPVFAHDRANIVFAYREYQRLMAHWRQVIPADRLLEVTYEDIVADREAMTRRMIDFAGLPWDDACLHHEQNQRAVRTPSLWQVRQPIYKTSVERWRRFEKWVPEFRALLNG